MFHSAALRDVTIIILQLVVLESELDRYIRLPQRNRMNNVVLWL